MKIISIAAILSLAVGSVGAIFGGGVVERDTYTFMGSLRETEAGKTKCSATLIGTKTMVTSVKCATSNVNYVVVGGRDSSGDPSGDGELRYIKNYTIHPSWKADESHYDVAVLQLEKEVSKPYARLPKSEKTDYGDVPSIVFGWGSLDRAKPEEIADSLHYLELTKFSYDTCKSKVKVDYFDTSFSCAGGSDENGVSLYDLGGPLITKSEDKNVLIGILTYVDASDDFRNPSIFTHIW